MPQVPKTVRGRAGIQTQVGQPVSRPHISPATSQPGTPGFIFFSPHVHTRPPVLSEGRVPGKVQPVSQREPGLPHFRPCAILNPNPRGNVRPLFTSTADHCSPTGTVPPNDSAIHPNSSSPTDPWGGGGVQSRQRLSFFPSSLLIK